MPPEFCLSALASGLGKAPRHNLHGAPPGELQTGENSSILQNPKPQMSAAAVRVLRSLLAEASREIPILLYP